MNKRHSQINLDVLASLKSLIDKKELSTAHRLRCEIISIFDYAIVHNFIDYDPAQSVAKQIPVEKVKHRTGIIDPWRNLQNPLKRFELVARTAKKEK
jgi:hypothetical protein